MSPPLLRLLAATVLAATVLVGATLLPSCAGRGADNTAPPVITGEAWRDAKGELQALRRSFSPAEGTMRVTVQFTVASDVLRVRGRGAVARRPPDDLRMILLGPGGVTAFDLLVRAETWRLKMPSRDRVVRHDDGHVSKKGLPVDFLRWWLLRPLSGRLLSVADTDSGRVYVLRDGDATIRVLRHGEGLVMDRRSEAGTERMWVSSPGCGTAVYQHVDAKVRARVRCEAQVGGVDAAMFR